MMPGRLIALVMLAGCLAAPATLAKEPVGPELPWNLLGCTFVYGTTNLPAARLAPYMPHNFRPFISSPALANTVAQVGFEVNVCAEGSGLDGQVGPMMYASTWTPAVAPPARAVPGIGMFVNWDVLVPDDERRAVLQGAGTPARDGDITISTDLTKAAATPFTVDYVFDGAGAFHFDVVPAPGASTTPGGGEFGQYTEGADGSLTYWRTEWETSLIQRGAGTITLDPESWQAEAFGATVIPAQFNFGQWEYTDGKIVLPS